MASQGEPALFTHPVTQPQQLDAHHILQHGFTKPRQPSASSTSSSVMAVRKQGQQAGRAKAYSSSSRNTRSSSSTQAENRAAQRAVRTLPTWIGSYEDDEEDVRHTTPSERLITPPSRAHAPQHNHSPSAPRRVSLDGYVDDYEELPQGPNGKKQKGGGFFGSKEPVKGRKWDHVRNGDPVIVRASPEAASPWHAFAQSTIYAPYPNEDVKKVDEAFLLNQTPGYDRPWKGDLDGVNDPEKLSGIFHSQKQRRTFIRRVQHILLMHPLVPLGFRLVVLCTSIIALAIAASVHHLSNRYIYAQSPSTTMAIVVDVIAIPYILYVTWDEYTGKPLGLRSPKAKIRLVLVDLWFIIFESANLAIAFEALTDDTGACRAGDNGTNNVICDRVKTLCAILMVALISWSLTFAVSIFRLVERVGGREEGD